MKRLLLLSFILITASCCAQSNDQYVPPSHQQQPQSMQLTGWRSHTAESEIQKAHTYYLRGIIMENSGLALFIIAGAINQSASNSNSNNNSAGSGAAFVGSVLFLTGITYHILGFIHLSRGNILLNVHHISMGPTPNGIGLTYKF